MSKESELIYDILEESLHVNRWAPLIIKVIAEECKTSNDGWCHISYREWDKQGITVWTLWRVLKWAKVKKIIQTKQEPPNISGGGRGKQRTAYRLNIKCL
jgi:hypothetical protein